MLFVTLHFGQWLGNVISRTVFQLGMSGLVSNVGLSPGFHEFVCMLLKVKPLALDFKKLTKTTGGQLLLLNFGMCRFNIADYCC